MTKFLSTFSGGGATLRGSMRGQAANRPNSIRGRAARSALSRGLNRGGAMGTGSNVRGAALQARRQRDTGALIRGGAMRNAAIRAARGVAARLRLFTHAGSSPQGRLTPWSP